MIVRVLLFVAILVASVSLNPAQASEPIRPNIVWLSTEDIGPHLGCYGYEGVSTPNIDAFAKRSLTYDTAWSNYPVCAPARTTIITGRYATALGAGNMRCGAVKPEGLKLLPELMREGGYYCTNNSKTDYNLLKVNGVWDQSSGKAHWRNRPEGKPFFSVFNLTKTHESKIRNRPHEQQIDPASVKLFPYWPDTPEVRQDWAQYLDNIQTLDGWVAKHLQQLEKAGLADDTIVFFWGDHGSGMPRHKRYIGDSGQRVPMIVHVPEKWKDAWSSNYSAGGRTDWPVGFVDLAPTVLRLAGLPIPRQMQGKPFLGNSAEKDKYVYGVRNRMDERYDVSRCVCDGRYVYIRNFLPHLPHGQFVEYQQTTPATAVWYEKFGKGELNVVQSAFWKPRFKEEIYDLKNDPHETKNLILSSNTVHFTKLNELRDALRKKMVEIGDLDLVPESMLYEYEQKSGKSRSTYVEQEGFDFATLFDAAGGANLVSNLESSSPELRFWSLANLIGSKGIYRPQKDSEPVENADQLDKIKLCIEDEDDAVRVLAAELFLLRKHEESKAIEVLMNLADKKNSNYYVACNAVDCLDRYRDRLTDEQKAKIASLPSDFSEIKRGNDNMAKLLRRFKK